MLSSAPLFFFSYFFPFLLLSTLSPPAKSGFLAGVEGRAKKSPFAQAVRRQVSWTRRQPSFQGSTNQWSLRTGEKTTPRMWEPHPCVLVGSIRKHPLPTPVVPPLLPPLFLFLPLFLTLFLFLPLFLPLSHLQSQAGKTEPFWYQRGECQAERRVPEILFNVTCIYVRVRVWVAYYYSLPNSNNDLGSWSIMRQRDRRLSFE